MSPCTAGLSVGMPTNPFDEECSQRISEESALDTFSAHAMDQQAKQADSKRATSDFDPGPLLTSSTSSSTTAGLAQSSVEAQCSLIRSGQQSLSFSSGVPSGITKGGKPPGGLLAKLGLHCQLSNGRQSAPLRRSSFKPCFVRNKVRTDGKPLATPLHCMMAFSTLNPLCT